MYRLSIRRLKLRMLLIWNFYMVVMNLRWRYFLNHIKHGQGKVLFFTFHSPRLIRICELIYFGLSLEGSYHVLLDNKDILLSLSNGDLYVIKLVENEETVTGIRLEEGGSGTSPSCACKFSKGYFILGSRLGDSHLIKYYKDQE